MAGNTLLQSKVLEDLSDAVRYRRWLADLVRAHLGDHPIEIGSGTGDYVVEWLPDVRRFTATEADDARFGALQKRFADHPAVDTRFLLLHADIVADWEEAGQHSSAVALNVLEHIADDIGAVKAMSRLVRPGGKVILIVPAFPSAMSEFDRAIGHQRRYTRASLAHCLSAAGLHTEEIRYINPLGLLSWYVGAKALRMTPRNGVALRLYDRLVVPVARLADRWRCPFGQSVFAVARTPTA